jgi:hypothetical protein
MIEGKCPVCGNHLKSTSPLTTISCTIRCKQCDSSIGLSVDSEHPSVVYTEVPEYKWVIDRKDYS